MLYISIMFPWWTSQFNLKLLLDSSITCSTWQMKADNCWYQHSNHTFTSTGLLGMWFTCNVTVPLLCPYTGEHWPVDADGTEVEDGGGAKHHIHGHQTVTNSGAEGPDAVLELRSTNTLSLSLHGSDGLETDGRRCPVLDGVCYTGRNHTPSGIRGGVDVWGSVTPKWVDWSLREVSAVKVIVFDHFCCLLG